MIGPARDWRRAPDSLRLATTAATSLFRGPGRDEADRERPAGVGRGASRRSRVGAESQALDDLAELRLAPLTGLRPASRQKLAETLYAWLRHWGQRAPRVAEDLNVHPQTVGYRLAQLRELFGDALDDPQVRFELELVLRAGRAS